MLRCIFVVLVFALLSGGRAYAQPGGPSQPARVLILPFDGSSAGKYSYLVDGIRSMIASRLSSKQGMQLVDYSLQEDQIKKLMEGGQGSDNAKTIYSELQIDYLVSGVLYSTVSGLKVQVGVFSSQANTPRNFSSVMENEDQLLTAVTALVDDLAQGISGVPEIVPVQPDDKVITSDNVSGFMTEHPEKQYKRGALGGGAIVGTEGETGDVTAKGVKRSSVIPEVIVSMDTGDLDGDGQKEIVFASRTVLQVFSYSDGRFQKRAELELSPTFKIHALNVADLDKDGKSEIFVSAHDRNELSSLILGWTSGSDLNVLCKNIRYFIRPLQLPGEGWVLAGQMGNSDPSQGFMQAGIVKLTFTAGYAAVGRGTKIPLPKKLKLFDFIQTDLDADGTIETVAIDRNEKMLVFDSQNNLLWVSDDEYGGSKNYVGPAKSEFIRTDNRDRALAYIPTKLLAEDVNGDGRPEIIIGRNKRVSPRWLENTRTYEGGTIACLTWDNSAMQELWRTNVIPGYIADYSFSFAESAGKNDAGNNLAQLSVGQVPEMGTYLGFLAAKESKLLVYEINIGEAKKSKAK